MTSHQQDRVIYVLVEHQSLRQEVIVSLVQNASPLIRAIPVNSGSLHLAVGSGVGMGTARAMEGGPDKTH